MCFITLVWYFCAAAAVNGSREAAKPWPQGGIHSSQPAELRPTEIVGPGYHQQKE